MILLICPIQMPLYPKVTDLLTVRREDLLQYRRSQGYLITNAHQIVYRPGSPDHVLDLSAPSCVAVPAGARTLFSPSAPPVVQLAVSVAFHGKRLIVLYGHSVGCLCAIRLPALKPFYAGQTQCTEIPVSLGMRWGEWGAGAPARGRITHISLNECEGAGMPRTCVACTVIREAFGGTEPPRATGRTIGL